jgi:thioredoxin-related protein
VKENKQVLNNLTKKIETLSHVATIIIAALLGVIVFQNAYRLQPPRTTAPPPLAQLPQPSSQLRAGAKLPLSDIDWGKNDRTLLLSLSQGCHFCSASAPFYQRLTQEVSGKKNIGLVALLPQPVNVARDYLNGLGVNVGDVRQVAFDSLGVVGTPTLILVDKQGVVINAWRGQLPSFKEEEVLNQVKCGTTQQCS